MAVLLLSFVSLLFYSAWLWFPFINQGWQVCFCLLKVHFLLGLTVISIYKSGKHFTTLPEESVGGRNFCGFGSFWKIGKSLLPQKVRSILNCKIFLLNRKRFFQQNVLVSLNHKSSLGRCPEKFQGQLNFLCIEVGKSLSRGNGNCLSHEIFSSWDMCKLACFRKIQSNHK